MNWGTLCSRVIRLALGRYRGGLILRLRRGDVIQVHVRGRIGVAGAKSAQSNAQEEDYGTVRGADPRPCAFRSWSPSDAGPPAPTAGPDDPAQRQRGPMACPIRTSGQLARFVSYARRGGSNNDGAEPDLPAGSRRCEIKARDRPCGRRLCCRGRTSIACGELPPRRRSLASSL